jgi:hypothetical protein
MATSYTSYNANVNSADYRLNQRPASVTTEAKIAHLRRYLADRAEFAWMESYKQVERELRALEVQV